MSPQAPSALAAIWPTRRCTSGTSLDRPWRGSGEGGEGGNESCASNRGVERERGRKSSTSADHVLWQSDGSLSLKGETIQMVRVIPEMPMTANPSLLPSKGWS
jgi:hypothetical protein